MQINDSEPRSEKNTRRTIMLTVIGAVLVVVAIFALGSGRDGGGMRQPSAVSPGGPTTPAPDASTPANSAAGSTAPAPPASSSTPPPDTTAPQTPAQ